MKSIGVLPLAIVLATPCILAQDVVLHLSPNTSGANCPVGLSVNHGSTFPSRKTVGPSAAPPSPAQEQRIQLTMTNLSPQEIVKAQITVHGLSDKWRYVPAAGGASARFDKKGRSHPGRERKQSRFE